MGTASPEAQLYGQVPGSLDLVCTWTIIHVSQTTQSGLNRDLKQTRDVAFSLKWNFVS